MNMYPVLEKHVRKGLSLRGNLFGIMQVVWSSPSLMMRATMKTQNTINDKIKD